MNNVKCLNPWDPQSKRQYGIDGVYATLNAGQAIGGQAHGICYAIEGNVVDRDSKKNGKGWCEDIAPTLNTQDRHAVVFTIDAMSSNSMKSSNPHSGIHETKIAKCLDTSCLNPDCNQGGHMVVIALEGNGARPSHMGKGFSEDGQMYTLNTIEQHSVCYTVDCRNLRTNKEVSGTLQAKDNGGFSYNYLNPVLKENEGTDISG